MWTTAPRLTVEVRLSQAWREGRKITQEGQEHLDWLPGRWRADNLLVVYVAKANLKQATRSERVLARQRHGAFVDVTDMPDEALTDGSLAGWEDDGEQIGTPSDPRRSASDARTRPGGATAGSTSRGGGRPGIDPATLAPGTALVLEIIRGLQASAADDGRLSANRIFGIVKDGHGHDPRADLVRTAHSGGKREARPGAINWHLMQLERQGVLEKRGRNFHVLPSKAAAGRT